MNNPGAQELKSLARRHMGARDLSSAQDVLRRTCELHRDEPEAWYLLDRVESAMNQPDLAVSSYENAVRLDPSSAAAHFHLAIARASLGQYSAALASMENCLALEDAFPNARLRISALYERTGQLALARQYAEQVIKTDAGNTEALGRIARTHWLCGNTDMAMNLYRQTLQANPEDFQTAAALADMQIKIGEIETASNTIAPFLKRKPVPRVIAFLFSDICQFTNSCDEAIRLLEEILHILTSRDTGISGSYLLWRNYTTGPGSMTRHLPMHQRPMPSSSPPAMSTHSKSRQIT